MCLSREVVCGSGYDRDTFRSDGGFAEALLDREQNPTDLGLGQGALHPLPSEHVHRTRAIVDPLRHVDLARDYTELRAERQRDGGAHRLAEEELVQWSRPSGPFRVARRGVPLALMVRCAGGWGVMVCGKGLRLALARG